MSLAPTNTAAYVLVAYVFDSAEDAEDWRATNPNRRVGTISSVHFGVGVVSTVGMSLPTGAKARYCQGRTEATLAEVTSYVVQLGSTTAEDDAAILAWAWTKLLKFAP